MKTINGSMIKNFLIWLLIVPPGIIFLFYNYYPSEVNWLNAILFTVFASATIYLSIKRKASPILLVMWVTLPAFLMYGILVNVIIMQVSAIIILFNKNSKVSKMTQFLFNSTLVFILSFGSAITFYLVGGEIDSLEFWPLLFAAFCYQLFHVVINYMLTALFPTYRISQISSRTTDFILNYATAIVILPFSLALYYLLKFIGAGSFLLVGLPFLFIIIVLKLYNDSEKINRDLKQAATIGHQLSDNLTEGKVIDQFVEKVSEMFNAEYTYLFDHKNGWLEVSRSYESMEFVEVNFEPIESGKGITGFVLKKNKSLIYESREQWLSESVNPTPKAIESVLCIPIIRNQKVEAVLFLSSTKKRAFKDYQLKILDILCSYFIVSIEKVRNVEATVNKSERCALTNLYNYIYLEERLEKEMTKLNKGSLDKLSVLMIDIDHFKKVNDTYGHESGNDVLCALAEIFKEMLPKDGVISRYGGEEFVYLLPGYSKSEAVNFAEEVRMKVQNHRFNIFSDLGENRQDEVIQITLSIGVSAALEDTDEGKTLLRNADRTLFLGAKQEGRNRVASYMK